jgi:muramoyltetrapeptide carboxypeptidase
VTIRPPRIKRGETLGIVAPAGPIKLDKLQVGLARLGDAFRLRLADSLTAPREANIPSYLSASDDTRVRELNAMLADRDVRAILLARGGYGLMRILPRLDVEALKRDPKPIIGFSDATALLAWAHAAGVRGIHGPMGVQMGVLADSDVSYLIELMSDARVPGVRPWSLATHGRGQHRGPLITANLTMLSLLIGTPWELPVARSITLIEEVGEKPYELDRYMTQLALTGQLAKMNAMVVGDLTRCADANPPTGVPDPEDAALQTILERARPLPIAVGAPIGHGNRNEAVPFGADAVLDLDAGTLEITEAAVD